MLTIIAYRQPVTRAFIDQLRGVDSSNTVSSLAERAHRGGRTAGHAGEAYAVPHDRPVPAQFFTGSIEDLRRCLLEENEQMELNMDGTLHETPPGEQLRFLNGEPVPPETGDRLWERFYSGF